MTSSLVGSEMCIRDSTPTPRACTAQPSTGTTTASLWRSDDGAQHTFTPVSYTHLTLPTICSV
eukprot:7429113-Prorocentrum_lima.AAC.1